MKLRVRTNRFLAPQLTQRRNHSLHSYSGAVCKTESQHWQRYCDGASKVNIVDPVVFKNSILLIHGWGDFATK